MPSARALLALARWPNALIAAAGVVVGAWWAHGVLGPAVLWAAIAAVAITVAANAWNDVADLAIDRIAHPARPLPTGALSPRQASAVAWLAAALALPFAWLATPHLVIVTLVVLGVARMYSPHLKRTGLLGNAIVAAIASLPFLYGAWAIGHPARGALLVAIAIPLHFAREVAKDVDDVAGDAAFRRTLPVTHGARRARLVIVAAAAGFLGALIWPAVRAPLFAAALVPAVALSLAGAGAAMRGRRGGPFLFKAAMVCAMLAVLAARP